MNGDETRAVFEKLDDLGKGQAGLKAMVETKVAQHDTEIKVLFDKIGKVGERVRTVEMQYVPDDFCAAERKENRTDHEKFRDGLDEQRSFSGKILGGAIVGGIVLGSIVAWVFELLTAEAG